MAHIKAHEGISHVLIYMQLQSTVTQKRVGGNTEKEKWGRGGGGDGNV